MALIVASNGLHMETEIAILLKELRGLCQTKRRAQASITHNRQEGEEKNNNNKLTNEKKIKINTEIRYLWI